jgi:uncharacterized protein (DUF2236 family)
MRGLAPPRPLRRLPESVALLITTGFLSQRFRDEMRLPWDAARQRRFDPGSALDPQANVAHNRPGSGPRRVTTS